MKTLNKKISILRIIIFFALLTIISCKKDGHLDQEEDAISPVIYVAGREYNDMIYERKVWRISDSTMTSTLLSTDADYGISTSLFVSEGVAYVTGYQKFPGTSNYVATLWKNGIPQPLVSDTHLRSKAYDIVVQDEQIFIIGNVQSKFENTPNFKMGTLWTVQKNGDIVEDRSLFSTHWEHSLGRGLDVVSNSIYSCGAIVQGTGDPFPAISINGKVIYMDRHEHGVAEAIQVQGSKIYIVGNYTQGPGFLQSLNLWTMDIDQPEESLSLLTLYSSAGVAALFVKDIFVEDNIIYVTGLIQNNNGNYPKLWKVQNGTIKTIDLPLTDNSRGSKCTSLHVNKGIAYIVGEDSYEDNNSEMQRDAILWEVDENDDIKMKTLSKNGNHGTARAVYVVDGN